MLVPLYLKNWQPYKNNNFTYQNNDYRRIDIKIFLKVLTPKVLEEFSNLDWFNLNQSINQFEDKLSKHPPIAIGDSFVNFKNFIIAAKLLFMTWFTSEYWFWNKNWLNKFWNDKFYTHHWIDLILPKWTPIESFSNWEVIFAGWKEGWGNVVIVKGEEKVWRDLSRITENYSESNQRISSNNSLFLYLIYAHLDEIKIENWQKVRRWDIIWTCWNSWNAKGYHLHFQIDTEKVSFHPYWGSLDKWFSKEDKEKYFKEVLEYCIDPWEWLVGQELWRSFEEPMKKSKEEKGERSEDSSEKINNNHKQFVETIIDNGVEDKNQNIVCDTDKIYLWWDNNKSSDNLLNLSSNQSLPDSLNENEDFDILEEILAFAKDTQDWQDDKDKYVNTSNDQLNSSKVNQNEEKFLNNLISKIKEKYSDVDDDIFKLVKLGIVHWDENWDLLLDKPLTRYEFALILYRLFMKLRKSEEILKKSEKEININLNEKFSDINWNIISDEGKNAINFVVSNWFMKGDWNRFYPWKYLTLVEFLAIIWRIFASLQDWKDIWYKPYIQWAKKEKLLQFSDKKLFKPILREYVFKILTKLLSSWII